MTASYLASTLLMGAMVVLVAIAVLRNRQWYHYSAEPADGTRATWAREREEPLPLLERPTTWIIGFFGLMLAAVGGVYAFVTSSAAPSALLNGPVLAVGGLLLGAYLLFGVYSAAKGRGHPSSIAAAETATVLGALFLVAVSAQLIG